MQEDLPLYRTHRTFLDTGAVPRGYRIPLPPGEYRVSLQFSERFFLLPGHRVFDIRVEGQDFAKEYEPISAGFAQRDVKTWSGQVQDGFLDVDLVPRVQEPEIRALEIEQALSPLPVPSVVR